MGEESGTRRLVPAVLWLLSVVAAGLVGWWAAGTALRTPGNPLVADEVPVVYTVVSGEVGWSLRFGASAEWPAVPLARSSVSGMVTTVAVTPGTVVDVGDVLFTVDLSPVLVAEGSVPMFRDLAQGASGPDVAQLQEMLAHLGLYEGPASGEFGDPTDRAVRAWQQALGIAGDGVVREGDVVFVPELPARVRLGHEVTVGERLTGGESAVFLLPEAPDMRVRLVPEQASLVPLQAEVRVRYPDGVWEGRIARAEEDPEFGHLDLFLEGAGGGPICGGDCARWIPPDRRVDFPVEVVVVPQAVGPVVPVAAITTHPDGTTWVTRSNGTPFQVTVVSASEGLAVVEGLQVGDEVLLFGGSDL